MIYAEFEVRAVEDRSSSIGSGHYAPKDVDFAILTIPGSRDTVEKPITPELLTEWKTSADKIKNHLFEQYSAWKAGQEAPLSGHPIREWPPASPAQVKTLLNARVKTVEDLADLPDEMASRIGMAALKQKAKEWIKSSMSTGKQAEEINALKIASAQKDEQIGALTKKVDALTSQLAIYMPEIASRQKAPELSEPRDEPGKRKNKAA